MSDEPYRYHRDELSLRIGDSSVIDGMAAVQIDYRDGHHYCILVDADERQEAAQALAGDGYDVLPRPGTHVKAGTLIGRVSPSTIDPANVRVGDVVEVEADDGSWLVRGEVANVDFDSKPYHLRLRMERHGHDGLWPCLTGATVRVVRRAEPEPDPEQVKALAQLVGVAAGETTTEVRPDKWQQMARELARRGVRVDAPVKEEQ